MSEKEMLIILSHVNEASIACDNVLEMGTHPIEVEDLIDDLEQRLDSVSDALILKLAKRVKERGKTSFPLSAEEGRTKANDQERRTS